MISSHNITLLFLIYFVNLILSQFMDDENGYIINVMKFIFKNVMIMIKEDMFMEVGLIIALFVANAIALDCLYNHRIKTTGALLILNLCLTVALAYQFKQMEKIFYLFLGLVSLVVIFFAVRFYITKKKQQPIIIDDKMIEEKD